MKRKIRELYTDKGMTQEEIATELDVTQAAISYHMTDMNIDTNDKTTRPPPILQTDSGHEYWQHHDGESKKSIYIHRLSAIAEYGFNKVAGNIVHHKNCIPWDNRRENLQVVTEEEHRNAEKWGEWKYENGEMRLYIEKKPLWKYKLDL